MGRYTVPVVGAALILAGLVGALLAGSLAAQPGVPQPAPTPGSLPPGMVVPGGATDQMMGMMGAVMGVPRPPEARPMALGQAIELLERYREALGNPDLELAEVMEFEANYYAIVRERSTGVNAFEVLMDRYTGAIHPEPGPNMAWNTRYMMGGMMGPGMMARPGAPSVAPPMPVSPQEAVRRANQFLEGYLPGAEADDPKAFYGYYTLHIVRNGQITGMLSVHGQTGWVWPHTWHGTFLRERELGE